VFTIVNAVPVVMSRDHFKIPEAKNKNKEEEEEKKLLFFLFFFFLFFFQRKKREKDNPTIS